MRRSPDQLTHNEPTITMQLCVKYMQYKYRNNVPLRFIDEMEFYVDPGGKNKYIV